MSESQPDASRTERNFGRAKTPVEIRFWRRVDRRGDGECWNWTGARERGYGLIRDDDGRMVRAHRVSLRIALGINLPKGNATCVDHICRNRSCVNPNHLRVVSVTTNNVENSVGASALNALKAHCPRGHPYSLENTALVPLTKKGRNKPPTVRRVCLTCYPGYWRQSPASAEYIAAMKVVAAARLKDFRDPRRK